LNWASLDPNGTLLDQSRKVCHWLGAGRSGEDAEHRRSGDRGKSAQRLEQLAVVVEVLLFCRNRRIDRARSIPDQHA